MKLISDQNIPLVHEYFSKYFDIITLPAAEIIPKNINNADVLLVRSVTKINKSLLESSQLKIIGTPTSGTDHVDMDYLKQSQRQFFHAPGCNSTAVADYVMSALAFCRQQHLLNAPTLRAGIIGVGKIGKKVQKYLEILGFQCLLHDPPRAELEPDFVSTPLSQFGDLDLVCVHTPLTHTGKYPTFHFLDQKFLASLKPGCILLNAGRGEVIASADLLSAGKHLQWILDVFADEPNVNSEIIAHALLATPHIAGHSIESKQRGTLQLAEQIFKLMDLEFQPQRIAAPALQPKTSILEVYNPWEDTQLLKAGAPFEKIRHRDRQRYELATMNVDIRTIVNGKSRRKFTETSCALD